MVKITIDLGDDRPKIVWKTCAFCNGSGHPLFDTHMICPVCHGENGNQNKIYVPPNPPKRCGNCGGNGRDGGISVSQPCRVCKGTGYSNSKKARQ